MNYTNWTRLATSGKRLGTGLLLLMFQCHAAEAVAQASYYYFKERIDLAERGQEVALLKRSDTGSIPEKTVREQIGRGLNSRGLDAGDLKRYPITGWWTGTVEDVSGGGASVTPLPMRDRVADISRDDTVADFVSPVFAVAGGHMFVTPELLVRFADGIPESVAEGILAKTGTVAERNWGGIAGAYRVVSSSGNGYDLLDTAAALAVRPEVVFAEPDMVVTGKSDLMPNDTSFANCWGLHNTGQFLGGVAGEDMDGPQAWDRTIGSASVKVLILDSGIDQTHPDINQSTGRDFTSDGNAGNGGPVNSFDSHGTPVGGCVSATINNSLGAVGIAPGCRSVSARAYITTNSSGSWTTQFSWTVDALAWAEAQSVRVTNNSNSFGSPSAAIATKYAETYAAGMVHFASAGNSGASSIEWPSSLPSVNAIAALTHTGVRANFSQYGAGLAFSAPGANIYTPDRAGAPGYSGGDYASVNGTSFASPYAAGVAALILSVSPSLTALQVEQIMQASCVDKGTAGYDTGYGWGAVNANNALSLAVCGHTVSPASISLPAAGGTGTLSVTAGGSCAWTAISSAGWLTVTTGASGTGSGVVAYSAAANSAGARSATITVEGLTHTVNQAAGSSLPANDAFTGRIALSGASGSVSGSNVGASKETGEPNHAGKLGGKSVWWAWTAPATGLATITTEGSSFDTVLAVYTGSSVGSLTETASNDDADTVLTSLVTFNATMGVEYKIAVDGFDAASGSITLAWNQATPCSYSVSPASNSMPAGGGASFMTVTAGSSCSWTAASSAAWLTITSGASGTGNGTVAFSADFNSGAARSATITVQGQTHTVNQAAACSYSLSPATGSVPFSGGTGAVTVTAGSGCTWTATSGAAWLTITSGATGTGNGTVAYSASPNSGYARSATITVQGQTYAVNQAGGVLQISGRITFLGAGVSGVVMTGLPGNPSTNAEGYFTADVPAGWSGTVTPTRAKYTFIPAYRTYTAVLSNQLSQDYGATGPAPETGFSGIQEARIWSDGGHFQGLTYNYSSAELVISEVMNSHSGVSFGIQAAQWAGYYHYDYAAARFSQLLVLGNISLDGVGAVAAQEEKSGTSDPGDSNQPGAGAMAATTGLSPVQQVAIWSAGGYFQDLVYNYNRGLTVLSAVMNAHGTVPVDLLNHEWAGCYHYDYTAERFTQVMVFGNIEL